MASQAKATELAIRAALETNQEADVMALVQATVTTTVWNDRTIIQSHIPGQDVFRFPFPDKSILGVTFSGMLEGEITRDETPYTQAKGFEALMDHIWEGGAEYDLRIGLNQLPLHNACHTAHLLFPETWKGKVDLPEFGDNGGWELTFPDKSRVIVGKDGGEVTSL